MLQAGYSQGTKRLRCTVLSQPAPAPGPVVVAAVPCLPQGPRSGWSTLWMSLLGRGKLARATPWVFRPKGVSWVPQYPPALLPTSVTTGPSPWGLFPRHGLVLCCRTWGTNIPYFSHDFTQTLCTCCCPQPGSIPPRSHRRARGSSTLNTRGVKGTNVPLNSPVRTGSPRRNALAGMVEHACGWGHGGTARQGRLLARRSGQG